ncbi:MAG: NlpC/P60 family protein [Desulfobaccales bacterium]
MAKRLLLGVLSLGLVLAPALADAVPTKNTSSKKKTTASKSTVSKASKKVKKSTTQRRSRSAARDEDFEPANAQVVAPPRSSAPVADNKPLIRVIPQRDGKFMLEPLTPKKDLHPLVRPSSRLNQPSPSEAAASQGHFKFEPWNFQELILSRAKTYTGARYSRGATLATSSATDCSGFVQYIYEGFKIDLPRSSYEQAQVGKVVTHTMDFSKLVPGDLLFFRRGGRAVGHAGIYLGEGKMIHASNPRTGVVITDLRQPYYQNTFVVAKRVFEVHYPKR